MSNTTARKRRDGVKRQRPAMSDELFAELTDSVREGGAIIRGVREPSRVYDITGGGEAKAGPVGQVRIRASSGGPPSGVNGALDIRALRGRFGLSQAKFAALLGISLGTMRNWEQGRREPEGAARVLLRVAAWYPEAVLSVVAETAGERPRGRKRGD
jgi:putative transcriptional regulator